MNSIFPATYSTLSPTALADVIAKNYKLFDVSCKLLVRGVGDTYQVFSSVNRFIFRVYRSSHRSLLAIEEEVNLLVILKKANVSISYPLLDSDGHYIQKFEAIEGNKYGVLFSYANGQSVKVMNEGQLRILGQEMARFHNVSTTIPLGRGRWIFDIETTLFKPLRNLKVAFQENPDDHAWLVKAAKQVEDRLLTFNTSAFSKGYCHFDFLPKNFHFDGDRLTIFDFDFMGYGWLVNDIMSFWQHLMLETYTGRMTRETCVWSYEIFLEGYQSSRNIDKEELAVVPYLALGFWLFYMSFHTTHDQFYQYSQPSTLKTYTILLKHLVDTYWNK